MAKLRRVETSDDLDALFRESGRRPVFLFKHSTRCGSSAAAWRDFESFVSSHEAEDAAWAFVEIPAQRELSEEIGRRTGIRHESPQVLLLRDGRAAWHASRWRISVATLERALAPDVADG